MGEKASLGTQEIPSWIPANKELSALFALESFSELSAMEDSDQRFEITVREEIVLKNRLSSEGISQLDAALKAFFFGNPASNDRLAFLLFFISFEWYHRRLNNKEERAEKWRQLFRAADNFFSEFPLFSYALSVYYRYSGDAANALQTSRQAYALAPGHIGFLNNYAEILLDNVEQRILSLQEETIAKGLGEASSEQGKGYSQELREVLDSFRAKAYRQDFSTFHINQGRLAACLGDYEEAYDEFDKAIDLATKQFEEKSKSLNEGERSYSSTEYVQLMTWITSGRNTCFQIKNTRAMRQLVKEGREGIQVLVDELTEKHEKVENQLNDERINMIEVLGFFAGVIALIVATIQIGSDMSFMSRAFLVLVLLGSLLIAFGSLSALLEGSRAGAKVARLSQSKLGFLPSLFPGRTAPVIISGALVIVLGIVLNAVM